MKRIGIDLGGTKIEAVVIDGDNRVLWRQRVPMPLLDRDGDLEHAYAQTLDAIAGLLQRAGQELPDVRALPVGIGTPGAECASGPAQGTMKNCNSVWLNGRYLRRDLETRLQRPVRLANDANCFALAEMHMGAARNAESVFGIILGTGVGGGLVIRGHLQQGANHIAGEWGHNRLPAALPAGERGASEVDEPVQQRRCYCGRYNCLETWLSGPGLATSYRVASGQVCKAEDVVAHMRAGDAIAQQVWQQYVQQLARALSQVINVVDPEVIVVGGGVSNVQEICTQVPAFWNPYIFTDYINTRLVRAEHGDSSGVFGAAWLWD